MYFAMLNICWLVVSPVESVMSYQDDAGAAVMIVADRDGNELRSCRFSPGNGKLEQNSMALDGGFAVYRMTLDADVRN